MAYGIKRAYGAATELSKAVGTFSAIGAVLFTVWANTLGPGITSYIREAAGASELLERVERIEANLMPLQVVNWDTHASRQLGDCNSKSCEYLLTGNRTTYGSKCGGVLAATLKLKQLGQPTSTVIRYTEDFTFVKLTLAPTQFTVPLDIPQWVPDGFYQWRSEVLYEDCTGINEPIIRNSPWWTLKISGQSERGLFLDENKQ